MREIFYIHRNTVAFTGIHQAAAVEVQAGDEALGGGDALLLAGAQGHGPLGGVRQRRMVVQPQIADVGRTDLCPCGSGKKFKYCHGRNR